MPSKEPKAVFVSHSREDRFSGFRGAVAAASDEDLLPALAEVEAAVAGGLCAAGYLAYEAAPGLNPELSVHPPAKELPLAWFGLYDAVKTAKPRTAAGRYKSGPWTAGVDQAEYDAAIKKIKAYLAAGDSYQVNYTFSLTAPFHGSAEAFFRALSAAQRAEYCAYLDMGRFQVLSASPELFFSLEGETLTTRPMKGTRPRSSDPAEDERLRNELAASPKEQAENLMIVDLLRNDMGRVSRTGSVEVTDLFRVEPYPTVWQMTSTIRSQTDASVPDILRALFPCGSVTGAPKRRTMEIIRELEPSPRGIYCGAVGYWLPNRRVRFNVAIRTVTVDAGTGMARYGVGSGITWDSDAGAEYGECILKAAVLDVAGGQFDLTEALLFDEGYYLLDRHLARLADSARFFGFCVDMGSVQAALEREAKSMPPGPHKVRLLVSRTGAIRVEHAPAAPISRLRVAIADAPVDERDVFLRHKTTRRDVYDKALAAHPDADDVLLWNSKGEITETCMGNIVADFSGELATPPLSSGLLPGTMRAELLARGEVREATITLADLPRADGLYMINSVRKRVPIQLAEQI